MADYIYLLQTRLTSSQQAALAQIRDVARSKTMTVFLVGGAVRDLTSGSPVRDLDVAVQGNATKLRKELTKGGAKIVGENDAMQALYLTYPGGVRVEVGSTLSVTFPKPGKPSVRAANILDDLRRRDFTANAMAISLNEGSYGLLMDPLNGVADIENRELRLVSNYGFIEDPSRMIRAARLQARLGWQLEERTRQRYENGKSEGFISELGSFPRSYELEEIFHEEDPLRVLRRLEAEGWVKALSPSLSSAKANEGELEKLRDLVGQLAQMGIYPDPSAAYFPPLTAKLSPKEVSALSSSLARPGYAEQVAALDNETKAFGVQFSSKAAAAPSDAWKMLFIVNPEAVLWLAHTSKSSSVQSKFKSFFTDWAQARQKIPYQLMQEMRITPDLPGYSELLERIFFAIMDAKLETPEATRAFLEPYSPPAPPPPVNLRRRPVKRETKASKARPKKTAPAAEPAETVSASGAPEAEGTASTAAKEAPAAKASSAAKPAARETASNAVAAKPAGVAVHGAKSAAAPAAKPAGKAASAPAANSKTVAKAVAGTNAKPGSGKAGAPHLKAASKSLAKTAARSSGNAAAAKAGGHARSASKQPASARNKSGGNRQKPATSGKTKAAPRTAPVKGKSVPKKVVPAKKAAAKKVAPPAKKKAPAKKTATRR